MAWLPSLYMYIFFAFQFRRLFLMASSSLRTIPGQGKGSLHKRVYLNPVRPPKGKAKNTKPLGVSQAMISGLKIYMQMLEFDSH